LQENYGYTKKYKEIRRVNKMDIIFDIDGTCANNEHRQHHLEKDPKDWPAFLGACRGDAPITPVCKMAQAMCAAGNRIIFCTGRSEEYADDTWAWLDEHVTLTKESVMYMRDKGDHRPDHEIKLDLLNQMKADGFNPELVIEDRQTVIDMWKSQGILVLAVNGGKDF
jgi:hypothetical protein